jgi:hypothetical protein
VRNALVALGIPAYPRQERKRQDRPVTPEVAGSSPVAPVKTVQNGMFCCLPGQSSPALEIVARSGNAPKVGLSVNHAVSAIRRSTPAETPA